MAGGNKTELGDFTLKRLASMLGEHSARQQQPVRREPMRRGTSSHDDIRAEELKLNEKNLKIQQEIAKAESEREKAQKAADTRAQRVQKAEEAYEVRRKKFHELDAKRRAAESKGDRIKESQLRKQMDAMAEKQRRQDTLRKSEGEYQKAQEKFQARMTKKIQEQTKAYHKSLNEQRDFMRDQKKLVAEKFLGENGSGRVGKFVRNQAESRGGSGVLGKIFNGIQGGREAYQNKKIFEATTGQEMGKDLIKAAGGGAGGGRASGGGGGGGGGIIGGAVSGLLGGGGGGSPWVIAAKAIGSAVTAVGESALEMDDKLLKLAGNYSKYTGTIKSDNSKQLSSLSDLVGGFKTSYVEIIKEGTKMGLHHEQLYERLAEVSKAFRPMGEDAHKTMSKMVLDSFQLQAVFGQTGEVITSAMTDSFRNFGMSGDVISEQMAGMYNSFSTGNEVLKDELGDSIIRMDEFSDIVFQSARKADLWSFNYKNVADKLATVAAMASKAGLAMERQQKLAKSIAGFEQGGGGSETSLGWMASEQTGADYQNVSASDIDKGEKWKDLSKQAKEALKRVIARKGEYEDATVYGQDILEVLSGTTEGTDRKKEQLRKVLAESQGRYGKEQTTKQFLAEENVTGLSNNETSLFMDEYLKKGSSVDSAMKRVEAARAAKKAGTGTKTEKGLMGATAGGYQVNEIAANGFINSLGNAKDNVGELAKAAGLAGVALKALAAMFGDKDANRAIKFNEVKKTKEFEELPESIKKAAAEGNASEILSLNKMLKEGMTEAVKVETLKKSGVGEDAAKKIAAAYEDERQKRATAITGDQNTNELEKYNALTNELGYAPGQAYKAIGGPSGDPAFVEKTIKKLQGPGMLDRIIGLGGEAPVSNIQDSQEEIKRRRDQYLNKGAGELTLEDATLDMKTQKINGTLKFVNQEDVAKNMSNAQGSMPPNP